MPKTKLLQLLHEVNEDRIPFSKLIGMKIYNLDLKNIKLRIETLP